MLSPGEEGVEERADFKGLLKLKPKSSLHSENCLSQARSLCTACKWRRAMAPGKACHLTLSALVGRASFKSQTQQQWGAQSSFKIKDSMGQPKEKKIKQNQEILNISITWGAFEKYPCLSSSPDQFSQNLWGWGLGISNFYPVSTQGTQCAASLKQSCFKACMSLTGWVILKAIQLQFPRWFNMVDIICLPQL